MLITAVAFCQFLIFANGILYPKLGKYVGKLTYEMSYKNTKIALKAIEKINTGLFKMDCELALEKVVSDGYDDGKEKSTDPIVDIYIYTIGLSRPRVEVLEEMRDEMQQCKSYAIEKINKYFNANLTENSIHNISNKRHREFHPQDMNPVEFSPNYETGNPREESELAIIDKTHHSKNFTRRQPQDEMKKGSLMDSLMAKIKQNQKENESLVEKPSCRGKECKKKQNSKENRFESSKNETEAIDTNEKKKSGKSSKSSEKKKSQEGKKEAERKRNQKNENSEEETSTISNSTSKRSSDKIAGKEKKEKQ